jgi:hypothetical protein
MEYSQSRSYLLDLFSRFRGKNVSSIQSLSCIVNAFVREWREGEWDVMDLIALDWIGLDWVGVCCGLFLLVIFVSLLVDLHSIHSFKKKCILFM